MCPLIGNAVDSTHAVRLSAAVMVLKWVGVLLVALVALGLPGVVAAEGSKDLTQSGTGARPFLEYIIAPQAGTSGNNEYQIAGIQRQTIIYAYAEAGETINLASSVMAGGFVGTNARIVAVPPNGGAAITFLPNATPSSTGGCNIAARVNEVAGPAGLTTSTGNSYTACQVTAAQTTAAGNGVWEIHFVAPTADRSNTPPFNQLLPTLTNANLDWTQATNATYVAAWDVTVANGTTPVEGRVYTKSLAVTTGANGSAAGVNDSLYVQAYDGALYEVDLNGIDGFTSVFFANTRGTIKTATQDSLYRSIQLVDGFVFGNAPPGFGVKNPFGADDIPNNNITHKLFFNVPNLPASVTDNNNIPVGQLVGATPVTNIAQITSPAPVPPTTTWLDRTYIAPQSPQNLDFVGVEGTIGQAGVGLGGFIRFNNPNGPNQATSYRIELDFGNGFEPRYLYGNLTTGANSVFWDGRDGNGVIVNNPSASFTVKVTLNNGEIHFPVIDAERHTNGWIINRMITTTLAADLYWDDRYNYTGNAPFDYSICAAPGNPPMQETPAPPYTGGVQNNTVQCYGSNRLRGGTNPADPILFTSPRSSLAGINSASGVHRWYQNENLSYTANNVQNSGFGNKRIINTWTYIPSPPDTITSSINVVQTDLQLSKQDTTPFPGAGNPYTYTVVVTNSSALTITGATLLDQVPASIAPINWTCTIVPGTSCSPASGTTTGITTLLNMQPNAVVTLIITGTAPATQPCNTATVIRPPDVTDTDTSNNTDSTGTPTSSIGLAMRVVEAAPRLSPNTYRVTMEYVVQAGSQNLTNIQVNHNLQTWFNSQIPNASSISTIAITSTDFTVSGFYDGVSSTGLLSGTNTLAPGQSGVILMTFEVAFPSPPGNAIYTSNATATGTRPDSTTATDQSTNGAIPDPNGNCDPTDNNDMTPLDFSADATSITLLSFSGSSGSTPLWASGWLGIAVGGVILLLLNVAATMLWLRRRTSG